jgi:hypothetical protein
MSIATPLAHGASPGPLNTGPNVPLDLDRSTWHREMERAMTAGWFRFDDPASASAPEPRAQPAAAAAASTPSRPATPAPVASTRFFVRSDATPKSDTPAPSGDGTDAGAAVASVASRPIAADASQATAPVDIAAPASAPRAAGGTMPVTGATLPASLAAVALSMAKLPSAAARAPVALLANAPGSASINSAALVQPVAAALVAALSVASQGSAGTGGTTQEPLTPPPTPVEEIPQALRDLFGPLPGEVDAAAPSAEIEEASAPAAAREEPSSEPAPPLRWHAEWDERGVRVWLGLDSAAGIDAPQLAQQVLQSLGEQGVRVLSLVCNGKALYGNAAPRDSNPQSNRRES